MTYSITAAMKCDGCHQVEISITRHDWDRTSGISPALIRMGRQQGWTRQPGETGDDDGRAFYNICPDCSDFDHNATPLERTIP